MLEIPSRPRALNGLVFLSCLQICSLVIFPTPLHAFGYFISAFPPWSCGLMGKKHLASALLFSSFVLAVSSSLSTLYLSFRIFALPPSMWGAETMRCTAQISGSSAFSSQSLQCCCLVTLIALWYLFLAALCSSCTRCFGSPLSLYTVLSSLLAQVLSCKSSLVHHLLDLVVGFSARTVTHMASCRASMSSSQHSFSCTWF